VALPHELKTTLGALLLLSHVTLLPEAAVLEVAALLQLSQLTVTEVLEECVRGADPAARVKIATKRRGLVQITVLKSEVRLPLLVHEALSY